MTSSRLTALLLGAALCFGPAACRKAAPATSEPSSTSATPLAQAPPEAVATPVVETTGVAPTDFKIVFIGTLDNSLNVELNLTRQGNKLSGSYFYPRAGAANSAEKNIALEGKVEKDGKATLTETTFSAESAETKTGEFKGVLDSATTNGEPRLRFLGVWTGTKGKKSLPFALTERRFDLGGYKLGEKPVQEKNKKQRFEIETSLPQLTGVDAVAAEKFNKAAAAFFTKEVKAFKDEVQTLIKDEEAAAKEAAAAEKAAEGQPADAKSKEAEPAASEMPPYSFNGGFDVIYANADLISILFSYSTYMGGAHPSHATHAFNYDLKRGVEVRLADLFAPKANFLKLISGYSVKELKKLSTTSDVESGAGPKLENYGSWNFTPLGLQFTFDPYQVGAYAVGAHEVIVPYTVLKPAAKPDGLLTAFIQ